MSSHRQLWAVEAESLTSSWAGETHLGKSNWVSQHMQEGSVKEFKGLSRKLKYLGICEQSPWEKILGWGTKILASLITGALPEKSPSRCSLFPVISPVCSLHLPHLCLGDTSLGASVHKDLRAATSHRGPVSRALFPSQKCHFLCLSALAGPNQPHFHVTMAMAAWKMCAMDAQSSSVQPGKGPCGQSGAGMATPPSSSSCSRGA